MLWYKKAEQDREVKKNALLYLKKGLKKSKNIAMQKKVELIKNVNGVISLF